VALADLRGKAVLVVFWATWCGACKESFPMLERIEREYAPRGNFALVAISEEAKPILKIFLEDRKRAGAPVGFTVLADQGGRTHVGYGARALPTLVVVRPDGAVQRAWTGAPAAPDIREAIDAALAEGGSG
jgi:thiol-disulfide isomerase/thioredoxin